MRTARRRRVLAVVAGGILVAGSVLGLADSAAAHNYLVSSTPASGETLTKLPARFVVTTNEGLLDLSHHGAGFAFDVEDTQGRFYGDGCVDVHGPSMSTAAALGAPGKYKVIWQIVSADGHVVSNEYSFTWAPAAGSSPTISVGSSHPLDCHGRSGGTAPPDPNLGQDVYNQPHANLGLVLGIGGGVLALGIALALVLLLTGRRRKPTDGE